MIHNRHHSQLMALRALLLILVFATAQLVSAHHEVIHNFSDNHSSINCELCSHASGAWVNNPYSLALEIPSSERILSVYQNPLITGPSNYIAGIRAPPSFTRC